MLDFICMCSADLFGTGRERKVQNENIHVCLQRDSEPRHFTTGKSPPQVNRPRRLTDDQWFNVLQDKMGFKLIKPLRDNTCQIEYGYMCI